MTMQAAFPFAEKKQEASVSARLRQLRTLGYVVERKRAQPGGAVYLYRVSWQGVCS